MATFAFADDADELPLGANTERFAPIAESAWPNYLLGEDIYLSVDGWTDQAIKLDLVEGFGRASAAEATDDQARVSPPIEDVEELLSVPDSRRRRSLGESFENGWCAICMDHSHFYSARGLAWLTAGLGVGAAMANTQFDEYVLHDSYTEHVILARNDKLYEFLHEPKFLGDGRYTIPIFAAAALSTPLLGDFPLGEPITEWGQRSLRTILVGAPPMLALQIITGASRPGESSSDSEWRPFHDDNGVSGHSFMGAVPFLSAAKMTENIWLKAGLYAASTLPGLSRVNDEDHYLSQVALGWWLAYLAASAIDRTETDARLSFSPFVTDSALGFRLETSY